MSCRTNANRSAGPSVSSGLRHLCLDGPDQDMFNVRLNDSGSVLFVSESAGPKVTRWRLPG